MPTTFACNACGAKDAIALPLDASTEVVCPACKRRQPRRDHELVRIQADLARGLAQAAAREKDAIAPGPEPTVCPSCGDDLWTEEHGCPICGHGRKRLLARQSGLIPFAVSFAAGVVGAAGAAAVGVGQKSGPWMNIFLVAMSMVFSGVGVRALQRPTSLSIAPVAGQDAWGKTGYGPSRQATHEEGTMTGAIFLVVGAGLLLLGVFFGKLAG